jgi:cardiolipin synthase
MQIVALQTAPAAWTPRHRSRILRAMPLWSTLYLISAWAIRIAMLIYVPQKRPAAASRTWLLLIFLLPWPGLLLYAIFGRIRVPRGRIEEQTRLSKRLIHEQEQMRGHVICEPELPAYLTHLPGLAARLGDFRVFAGNSVELLADYEGTISRLVGDIDAATHHVHVLTYIFADDATGQRVVAALEKAARRGVQCRLMADAVGSRDGLHRLTLRLREAGVEVVPMLPVGFWRHNAARFDLRNHRKLAVIDGRIGYAGSQNIVEPCFVPGYPNQELTARVTGPVVAQIQAIVLADRYVECGAQRKSLEPFFPDLAGCGVSPAQLLPSTPGYQRENGEEFFVALLHAARRRIVITTPYFVPNEPFFDALITAVRRGVDVRLIVSQHANQRLTQLAQCSYYDELLDGGVRVHLYRPGFLHAKHLSIDDSIALLGSSNIDIRSFALNAEASLIVYDPAVVAQLRAVEESYIAQSEELDFATWRERPPLQRTAQNLARLLDSLL